VAWIPLWCIYHNSLARFIIAAAEAEKAVLKLVFFLHLFSLQYLAHSAKKSTKAIFKPLSETDFSGTFFTLQGFFALFGAKLKNDFTAPHPISQISCQNIG
jgi:hypothetical protein